MNGPVFAVVDGGHYDDLPAALSVVGLLARSLFLGEGEREVQLAGPWLVPVAGEAERDRVLALVGERPAVVFWSCPVGDVALYGHLRRLNLVRLPGWAAAGKTGPDPDVEADRGWDTVLFRHWDPRVLGALLPVLDEAQFSRILGPAAGLAFHVPDGGGAKRVFADPDWPVAPAGPLTIRPEQIQALTERRLAVSRRRMSAYLRNVAPAHVAHLGDGELGTLTAQHQREALLLGVRGDAETFMWSYMRVTSAGDLSRDEGITRLMADPRWGPDPDARLRRLFELRTEHLRQLG